MSEVKWRFFNVVGSINGKSKKIGIRALNRPSITEAKEICKDYLDDVTRVDETTEDLICYSAV